MGQNLTGALALSPSSLTANPPPSGDLPPPIAAKSSNRRCRGYDQSVLVAARKVKRNCYSASFPRARNPRNPPVPLVRIPSLSPRKPQFPNPSRSISPPEPGTSALFSYPFGRPAGERLGMVFYFKARPDAGDYTIFMGLDKHENEDLIKYGFPEDIWFHVDKMSSAHVYLRLNKGQTMDDISEGVLEDCAQLVKANSIQGNKVNNVDVVYTPWFNLKKTPSMDVGQVGFHNSKLVRTVQVEKRLNEVVNRLNKTKVERTPDLKAEREAVSAAEKAERKLQLRDKKRKEEMERLEKEKQAEIRSYKGLMVQDKMTSNKQVASGSKTLQELEEDFM
uniref:Uncharacterized protein n=3 Tax=Avena sativa TaxID=4498 RepID=A0ACD5U725_AVESA